MIERHDAIADVEDVVHAVADEDDADAVILEAADEIENLANLLDGESGGRLVHDNQARIESGGAGDGDRLALSARQFLDRLFDAFHMDLESLQMFGRHGAGLGEIDDVEAENPAARLAAQIDVLENRQVSGKGEILVDHFDADPAGIPGACELDGAAIENDLARPWGVEA